MVLLLYIKKFSFVLMLLEHLILQLCEMLHVFFLLQKPDFWTVWDVFLRSLSGAAMAPIDCFSDLLFFYRVSLGAQRWLMKSICHTGLYLGVFHGAQHSHLKF